jgi:hypothetical protein
MRYYDPTEIRAIPLVDVARRLGLPVDTRGRTACLAHWGGKGAEPFSCSLDEPDNYFRCPCGNGGWTTDLVIQARQCDVVEALQWLGVEFGLTPLVRPAKTDYVSRSRGLGRPDGRRGSGA